MRRLISASRRRSARTLLVLVAAATGIACGGSGGARGTAPSRGSAAGSLSPRTGAAMAGFDRVYDLPFEPKGLVAVGKELVAGTRGSPLGLAHIAATTGDGLSWRVAAVKEPAYSQDISIDGIAWNGTALVALAMGSWFQRPEKTLFVTIDSATHAVKGTTPAPDLVGGLAWDGKGYWAATRRNTQDAAEPAHLYRLDAAFQVTGTFDPPAVGCQGLAWDGSYLWFVDVFTDEVFALDVAGEKPLVVRKATLPFGYASGVAWDGSHLWFCEYGEKRLYRADPAARAAWLGEEPSLAVAEGAVSATPAAPGEAATGEAPADVEALRKALRSDDRSERRRAEGELDRLGIPVDFVRHEAIGEPEMGPEETDLLAMQLEMKDDRLVASWSIWVGHDMFGTSSEADPTISMPVFAKYRMTVKGGTLAEPIEREFEATPGQNDRQDEELASGLGPGKYDVTVFIHVQYVDRDGQNRIVNDSAGWLQIGR